VEEAAYRLRQHRIRTSLVLSFTVLPSDRADSSQSPFSGIPSTSRPSRSHLIPQCPLLSLFLPNSYSTSSPSLSDLRLVKPARSTCPANRLSALSASSTALGYRWLRNYLSRKSGSRTVPLSGVQSGTREGLKEPDT